MGRIDEALRRAGDLRPAVTPHRPADAVALAQEPFPPELPDESAFVDEEPLPAADVALVKQPAVDAAEPAAETPGDAEPSLLEHYDATLAGKIVIDQAMQPAFREQYRRLAAALRREALRGPRVQGRIELRRDHPRPYRG